MKNKFLSFLSVVVVVLFLSCEYQFSDDYYKEIELVEPSGSLSLINFNNGDTLRDAKKLNIIIQLLAVIGCTKYNFI